jgi:hypothetical protein
MIRTSRNRVPIKRLQNEQAANADKIKTKRKAPNDTSKQPNKIVKRKTASNINTNPKTRLLNTLARLRNTEAPNKGLERNGYTFLASLYRNHPSSQLQKYAFEWSNDKRIEFMKRQHYTLIKNTSRLNANKVVVNIPMNDEKMHDLLLMLWMDMSHDKLFKGSFNDFLMSDIKKLITEKYIKPMKTNLVDTFITYTILKITNGYIELGTGIEQKLKKHMHDIWGDPSHLPKIVKKTASVLNIVRNRTKPIYVSYDAENSNYITSLMDKTRMNNGTYYLKRIFTIANLMDPGRGASANVGGMGKSGGSVNKLFNRLFDEKNTTTPFKFNYQMFKFNFDGYFKLELVQDGSKFNVELNGKMMNMQIKKDDAAKGNAIDRLSKTFGDFIQILTVAHLRKSGINIVSSTQDGGFVGMTGFVQGMLFGIEPALISDSTTLIGTGIRGETGIKLYGLHQYLKYNVEPERSGVTTKNIRGNVNNNNTGNSNSNVTRNKLIQNLKKKNLPNFVINGLVKSFDNKQKTANQIIREATNFSKTLAMGKTAQRIGTLRKRQT